MNILVYFNQESFKQDEYGDLRIGRQSVIRNIQVDEYRPNYVDLYIWKNQLQDEIEFIKYGEEEEFEYNTVEFASPIPSAWFDHPSSGNPDGRYKFTSIAFQMCLDSMVIERSTYSILEWLGDVGGLFDALLIIGALIASPMVSFTMRLNVMHSIFRYVASLNQIDPDVKKMQFRERMRSHLNWDIDKLETIPTKNFCSANISLLICRHSRYKRMMGKANVSVAKELDLLKFIRRQRFTQYALFALMNGRQLFMTDKLSNMLIRESSDFEESEDDMQLY